VAHGSVGHKYSALHRCTPKLSPPHAPTVLVWFVVGMARDTGTSTFRRITMRRFCTTLQMQSLTAIRLYFSTCQPSDASQATATNGRVKKHFLVATHATNLFVRNHDIELRGEHRLAKVRSIRDRQPIALRVGSCRERTSACQVQKTNSRELANRLEQHGLRTRAQLTGCRANLFDIQHLHVTSNSNNRHHDSQHRLPLTNQSLQAKHCTGLALSFHPAVPFRTARQHISTSVPVVKVDMCARRRMRPAPSKHASCLAPQEARAQTQRQVAGTCLQDKVLASVLGVRRIFPVDFVDGALVEHGGARRRELFAHGRSRAVPLKICVSPRSGGGPPERQANARRLPTHNFWLAALWSHAC